MFRSTVFLAAITATSLVCAQETTLPLGGGVDLTVIRVEPGTFQQGSPATEAGRGSDESQRSVSISRSYFLGKSPITRGQFARFVAETNFRTEAEKGTSGGFGYEGGKLVQRREYTWRSPGFSQTDNDPVVTVTWNDAQAFMGWLSRKTGSKFEFPTEAQWEFACRAGTDSPYAGAATADEIAWHKGNAEFRTHPVGEKAPNAWGFTDMLGNVWEWCADWYAPYSPEAQTDPVQTNSNLSDKPRRVLRGGSWLKDALGVRTAARFRNDPQSRNPDNGFRVMAYSLDVTTALERLSSPPTIPAASSQRDELKTTPSPVHPPQSHRAPASTAIAGDSTNTMTIAYSGLGCLCFASVILLFFVRRIFRGESGAPAVPSISLPGGIGAPSAISRSGGAAPRSRMVEDGFWIEGGNVPVGTTLKCRYVVGGVTQETDIKFDARPGGQFVFTGQRPSSVSIIVGGEDGGLGSAAGMATSMFENDDEEERRAERLRREEAERRRRRDDSHSAY